MKVKSLKPGMSKVDARYDLAYCREKGRMKLIFKTLLIIALLALLVIMGLNNHQTVDLRMPPILPNTQRQPAAIMYFAFFGIGFLSGTLLMAGGKKGGGSKSNKVQT
jgi:uncharacterized integral membrane protein